MLLCRLGNFHIDLRDGEAFKFTCNPTEMAQDFVTYMGITLKADHFIFRHGIDKKSWCRTRMKWLNGLRSLEVMGLPDLEDLIK